jgi:hypothetical protein
MVSIALPGVVTLASCALLNPPPAPAPVEGPTVVVVVAPVLNMSNSADFDPLKVTDIVASELSAIPSVAVIPVNRTVAALAASGKGGVHTPDDAIQLAEEFGADATVVTVVTAFDPYDPPALGVVMQWYGTDSPPPLWGFDPVTASRQVSEELPVQPAQGGPNPRLQIQRYYNAANEHLLDRLEDYAEDRDGHESPYEWRRHVVTQELFVRYCIWDAIKTMLSQGGSSPSLQREHEARR